MAGVEELPLADDALGQSNILLLAPANQVRENKGCAELLSASPGTADRILCITLSDSPDDRIETWRGHLDDQPATSISFIDVNGKQRSSAMDGWSRSLAPVRPVGDASDLTELGVAVSESLSQCAQTVGQTSICFHSLTGLLDAVSVPHAYHFLNILTSQVTASDSLAHYHLDPEAHGERTVSVLSMLFDAIIEPVGEEKWTVTREYP